jgi:hypothetical protein
MKIRHIRTGIEYDVTKVGDHYHPLGTRITEHDPDGYLWIMNDRGDQLAADPRYRLRKILDANGHFVLIVERKHEPARAST